MCTTQNGAYLLFTIHDKSTYMFLQISLLSLWYYMYSLQKKKTIFSKIHVQISQCSCHLHIRWKISYRMYECFSLWQNPTTHLRHMHSSIVHVMHYLFTQFVICLVMRSRLEVIFQVAQLLYFSVLCISYPKVCSTTIISAVFKLAQCVCQGSNKEGTCIAFPQRLVYFSQ